MKNAMAKTLLLLAALSLCGCNTWAGLGKDMQTVGKKMEDAGERRR